MTNFEEIKEAAYIILLCIVMIVSFFLYIKIQIKKFKKARDIGRKIRQEQIRKAQEKVKGE